jgi:hypothetical protein
MFKKLLLFAVLMVPVLELSSAQTDHSPGEETICEAASGSSCYYLSPQGSDTDNGSYDSPWKTFTNAVSNSIKPGDIIYARGGIYSELPNLYGAKAVLCLNTYAGFVGDAATPVTYKSYPGETAIIDPGNVNNGVYVQGANKRGIIIEGFEIRNSWISGIRLEDTPSHITIRKNHIYNTDGPQGANVGGIRSNSAHDIVIENNLIHSNYQRDLPDNMNNANIFIFSGTTGFLVRNNEMYDSVQGLFYKHSGYGSSTFENNYLHDLRGNGFLICTDNITMQNNLLRNISGTAFNIHLEGGCTECSRNNSILHNTTANCGGSYLRRRGSDRPGAIATTVRDNIFFSTGNPSIWRYGSDQHFIAATPDLRASYNNYSTSLLNFNYFGAGDSYGDLGGIYLLSQFQEMGFELNSFNADPGFQNISGGLNQIGDFSLTSDSPGRGSASDNGNIGANIGLVGIIGDPFAGDLMKPQAPAQLRTVVKN